MADQEVITRDVTAPCQQCGNPVQDGSYKLDLHGRGLFEKSWLLAYAMKAAADPRAAQLCNSCMKEKLQEFINQTRLEQP